MRRAARGLPLAYFFGYFCVRIAMRRAVLFRCGTNGFAAPHRMVNASFYGKFDGPACKK
ncbi:hypothetical protein C7S16_1897 [Burkholderia thailandensis]|uniref:Uncharacterized protein n=1 Tax=Burkholderia thailandensis TaxID=57975 RepID=A0AAW9D2F9_BURTH|nr:hypothetical protein [Burkholderia thailandensis]